MPNPKDLLAAEFLELARRREAGEFVYVPGQSAGGAAAIERNNWNVTAGDMDRIEAMLADDTPFTDKALETGESNLNQINDAVRRMKRGDVSKYNHLPAFLREYYGRKALIEAFGSDREFPPLDENLKRILDERTIRPEFRDAITRLIERNAVDANGGDAVRRLREYDVYLNERMIADTLAPPSAEDEARLRAKHPGPAGERMLAENEERQHLLAKFLFMAQLGRVDTIDEDGTRHPYQGSTIELFSHGSRVAFSLPRGDSKVQDRVYDAWQKRALDSGVMFKGRFASHEMHRREIDANGNLIRPFGEIRIRWMRQLKQRQFNKKLMTYIGNYGMNLALGGIGRSYNRTDCVDTQGAFGHLYVRTRKGDETHGGSILMGFENAQPKKESCIGQLHNYKAVSHDLSVFYSTKTTHGKPIGGRETDLTHISPLDLTEALEQFELGYRTLRQRAKRDPQAARQVEALNQKLCGKRLSAAELADLMTSLGMEKRNALRCVYTGRSPKDAGYPPEETGYGQDMYRADPGAVREPPQGMPTVAASRPKKTAPAIPEADKGKYQNYIGRYLQVGADQPREILARNLSKVIAANFLKETKARYSEKTIDRLAKSIRGAYALDLQKPEDLRAALESEGEARSRSIQMRDQLYKVPVKSERTYCMYMNKVLTNMVDPKGHSTAYRKLYENVKKVAQMEHTIPWKDPNQRAAALMEANMRLFESVRAYVEGKETPRKTLNGVNTFDSALDAVSALQRFVPGIKLRSDALIAGINKARNPEERMKSDALTKEYGRGVNRNEIRTWEELDRIKTALRAPRSAGKLQASV